MTSGQAERPAPSSRGGRAELLIGAAAIAATVVIIVVVPQLRHCVGLALGGHFRALHRYVHSLGAGGLALLLGLMLAHAIIFYPSEIVTATAAFVYGFGAGLAFVVGGWFLAALLTYALGRSVGGPLLRRVLGERFSRLERLMERGGTALLLSGRLIPVVPFALLGYAAGATNVKLWRFSWTTVVGYLPLTTAVSYLGSRAETVSAADPLVWVAAAGIIALLAAGHLISRHRSAAT
jgi:uncharacterized membrane protein YdjX (TVP38/TMEM64 family)